MERDGIFASEACGGQKEDGSGDGVPAFDA